MSDTETIVPEFHDDFADLLAGEVVEPDHDLDLSTFTEVEDDEEQSADILVRGDGVEDFYTEPFAPLEARSPLGATWHPAPSITALVRDLDKAFPNRTQPDWIIGDADHSSRVSDHNPDERGMVHAIDIRLGGGLDVRRVLNATIGDPRVWYVIHDGKIYSRTYGWVARAYTGANPHTTHIHVSIRYTDSAEQDTSEWGVAPRVKPVPIDLSVVRSEFRKALGVEKGRVQERAHVKRLQRALNVKYPTRKVGVDGLVGKKTLNAWGYHERSVGGLGRPRVPDERSLARLVQPRWKMVE